MAHEPMIIHTNGPANEKEKLAQDYLRSIVQTGCPKPLAYKAIILAMYCVVFVNKGTIKFF